MALQQTSEGNDLIDASRIVAKQGLVLSRLLHMSVVKPAKIDGR